ncbi:hypothetical protein [Actinoplanes sp. ATCC 53533]|uniref:hypothetical protein n=1 Tax=Actinoplanes sp. ATCC 53533 TaxID=1288362 RepID=UPI0018F6A55B|nr:hypothetical protein [Actinoplanes sp. ATCC 53533]
MATRTMARIQREPTEHTSWCTRDHRRNLGEHRSADLIADGIGGRAVITRIRTGNIEYAEIRARIPLHSNESGARWQISTTLRLMRELVRLVAVRPGILRAQHDRPSVDRTAKSPVNPVELHTTYRRTSCLDERKAA